MSKEDIQPPPLALPRLRGVHAQPLELNEPFIELVARCAHLPGTVALLSGGDLDCARYHLLGLWPWLSLCGRSHGVQLQVDGIARPWAVSPLTALNTVLKTVQQPEEDGAGPMAAGLMGYLAYDLKGELETLPRTSVDDLGLPLMLLYAPALLVVHDLRNDATEVRVALREGFEPQTDLLLDRLNQLLRGPAPVQAPFCLPAAGLAANFTRPQYEDAVRCIVDYIRAGDVYQVNLSQRFTAPFQGDSFALFRHLWQNNPAPFFAFIQAGDHQILSTSPERFVRKAGRRVETRPIKGTRPRGHTDQEDAALRAELSASPKDDAELSMIVDLLRNDLGKVCRAGSVRVTEHKRLEAYRNVYHLVSIVEGDLEAELGSVDLLRAIFPGGSITGCPKVRAMQIIDQLEPCRRHVYCGSIGYIGFDGCLDLSIAIRTATIVGDTLCFSVGGGVVFDSDPAAEYEETLHKGRTLLSACQPSQVAETPAMVWCNGRLLPAAQAAVPVSDQGLLYGYGFFETIRVARSRAPLLADHLQRLRSSWQALMPGSPPDITWEAVIDQVIQANGLQSGCAAVKILITRGSRTAAPWDHTLLVTARPYTHRLAGKPHQGLLLGTYPQPRQTPLADFKSLNYLYYLRAGQWAQANGYDEALILNPDGSVSETNTANLLIVQGREVIRPTSAAVLPGVMAAAAGRLLKTWGYTIVQRPVQPAELLSADQVLAANALMGAVPVLGLDASKRTAGDDLWRRINADLFERAGANRPK